MQTPTIIQHQGVSFGYEFSAVEVTQTDRNVFDLLNQISLEKNGAVIAVDIGCATGDFSGRLAFHGATVFGYDQIDSHASFAEINRQLGRGAVHFTQKCATQLKPDDFPDQPDLIVINRIGHFLSDIEWKRLWNVLDEISTPDTYVAVNFMTNDRFNKGKETSVNRDDDDNINARFYLRHSSAFLEMIRARGYSVVSREPHNGLFLAILKKENTAPSPVREETHRKYNSVDAHP